MKGEASLEKSPKNIMIQDIINSENSMNTTESTNTNIFKINTDIVASKPFDWIRFGSIGTDCILKGLRMYVHTDYSQNWIT